MAENDIDRIQLICKGSSACSIINRCIISVESRHGKTLKYLNENHHCTISNSQKASWEKYNEYSQYKAIPKSKPPQETNRFAELEPIEE